MSTAIVPAKNLRPDRRPTMLSDDIALRKQLQATHAYDEHSIDTQSILAIVDNILNLVSQGIDDGIINVSLNLSLFNFFSCLIL